MTFKTHDDELADRTFHWFHNGLKRFYFMTIRSSSIILNQFIHYKKEWYVGRREVVGYDDVPTLLYNELESENNHKLLFI